MVTWYQKQGRKEEKTPFILGVLKKEPEGKGTVWRILLESFPYGFLREPLGYPLLRPGVGGSGLALHPSRGHARVPETYFR
jgi:hypothetical protein|tara:strand:+ start:189 stop:431 length:243 start_codon:yes stop_codon:yes gene_type:complete